jgi:hypothetical protein
MSERASNWLSEAGLPAPLAALLQRGQSGARLRFGLLVFLLSLYWFLVTLLADFPPLLGPQTLAGLPPLVAALLQAVASFFAPRVLIFVLPALLGLALALYGGAHYLTDLYELESPAIAWRYLLGATFGLSYPTLVVHRGELDSLDQRNPLLRIGGPGYLLLHLGFAAVFETPTGQPRVYGPSRRGPHGQPIFIPGFERLREVIDLRDQLRQLDQVPAVTRDGIQVFARDVQIVFRAYAGEARSLQQPYPFDPRSILSLVYGQVVGEDGPARWTEALPELARSELRSFVAQHTLEEFLAIRSEAAAEASAADTRSESAGLHIPRRQLTESFHTPERRQRLRELGLELVWVGVGTWEVRDDQIPSLASELGAGQALTTTLRDQARARRLRTPQHLTRERQLAAQAFSRETLEELIQMWRQGQLPGEYRCFESLERIKRRLIELQRRVQDSQPPGEIAAPEALAQAIQHLERLTDRSPAL